MFYKVFVDDSGFKNYITPYSREFKDNPPAFERYEQFWRENYFVLCGVRINTKHLDTINRRIIDIKKEFLGHHHIELKSDWLRNPERRKKHYGAIPEHKLTECVNAIYDMMYQYRREVKLLAVVFDKRYFGDAKRNTPDGDPLAKTSQVLFDRLQYLNTYHVVIFDQMEDSLHVAKGSNGKILQVYKNNTPFETIYTAKYDKIADIGFAKSSTENFLQIADLCAYNVHRQFVQYGREWGGKVKDASGSSVMNRYPYFDKVRCNFIHKPSQGKAQACGFGLICVPDVEKYKWDLLEGCDL